MDKLKYKQMAGYCQKITSLAEVIMGDSSPRNYQHTHVNDSRNQTCSSHQLVKHTITPQQSNISVKLCFATGMHAFIISKLQ